MKSLILQNFHNKLLSRFRNISKRQRVLYLSIFYSICLSIFFTIFGQLPAFSTRGITQFFQLPWVVVAISLVIFQYKKVLATFFQILLILCPFVLYLIVSSVFGIAAFSFQGTYLVLISFFIYLIGICISPYVNTFQLKSFCVSFLVASLVYAAVIYISKLRGVDISGSVYALGSKNSAAPILMVAIFCSLYVFSKKNIFCILFNIGISVFLITLIALMKCRTVLIALPFIGLVVLHFLIKNWVVKISIVGLFIGIVLLVIFVPSLNQKIIQDILLNGKTTIDDIFSGRITQIINGFSNFKYILGSGSSYVDCMPICFLLTYGILGFLSLLPFSVLPIASLLSDCGTFKSKRKRLFIVCLIVLFFFEYLLEGFGYFGPGAKSFIFWFIAGIDSNTFFEESNSKTIRKLPIISELLSSKINPTMFCLSVSFVLSLVSVLSFPSTIFSYNISDILYRKIPSSTVVMPYNSGTIDLDYSVEKMCVGQKITFTFKSSNANCDDICANVSTYNEAQIVNITVDPYRNEIIGLRRSWVCYGYTAIREKYRYAYISVCEPDLFTFDNLYISNKKYTKSFDHMQNVSIEIGTNSCYNLYYDNYYIPDTITPKFVSSDDTVAVVDEITGQVTGKSVGECDITAYVENSEGRFESKNKIHINVKEDSEFTKCTSLDLVYDEKCYQYVPFKIDSIFNEGASITDVNYKIEGLEHKIEDNLVTFLETGTANIEVTSVSNPLLSEKIIVSVLENAPVSFSCKNTRIQVGYTYAPADLGLYLNFKSGHSVLVSDDLLKYDPLDYRGRAWHERNGLVKDRCTIKAVKTGGASMSLTSKYDENVKATFYFDVIKYTNEEYNNIISSIRISIVSILSMISIVFVLLIGFKKKYIKSIIIGSLMLLFTVLSLIFVGTDVFGFICMGVVLITGGICILLNQLVFKDDWPHILSEEIPQEKKCEDDES